jgi:hypothetical protein
MADLLTDLLTDGFTTDGTAITDAHYVEVLRSVRSRVLMALNEGHGNVDEYWIGDRRLKRRDLFDALERINKLLQEALMQLTSNLPRRNYARVVRTT